MIDCPVYIPINKVPIIVHLVFTSILPKRDRQMDAQEPPSYITHASLSSTSFLKTVPAKAALTVPLNPSLCIPTSSSHFRYRSLSLSSIATDISRRRHNRVKKGAEGGALPLGEGYTASIQIQPGLQGVFRSGTIVVPKRWEWRRWGYYTTTPAFFPQAPRRGGSRERITKS